MPVTIDELVALGEQVYNGKGACALCHSPVAGRAPLLERAAAAAEARVKEKGYNGRATNAVEYLYESLVAPSAFVVPGFGASGTNDTISPMPGVKESAIGFGVGETATTSTGHWFISKIRPSSTMRTCATTLPALFQERPRERRAVSRRRWTAR